jgi:hypothetical protein
MPLPADLWGSVAERLTVTASAALAAAARDARGVASHVQRVLRASCRVGAVATLVARRGPMTVRIVEVAPDALVGMAVGVSVARSYRFAEPRVLSVQAGAPQVEPPAPRTVRTTDGRTIPVLEDVHVADADADEPTFAELMVMVRAHMLA